MTRSTKQTSSPIAGIGCFTAVQHVMRSCIPSAQMSHDNSIDGSTPVTVEHYYDPTFFERDLSVINEGNESSNSSSGHPDARNVPYLLDDDELSFLMKGSHPSSDPTPGVSTNPTLRDVRAIRRRDIAKQLRRKHRVNRVYGKPEDTQASKVPDLSRPPASSALHNRLQTSHELPWELRMQTTERNRMFKALYQDAKAQTPMVIALENLEEQLPTITPHVTKDAMKATIVPVTPPPKRKRDRPLDVLERLQHELQLLNLPSSPIYQNNVSPTSDCKPRQCEATDVAQASFKPPSNFSFEQDVVQSTKMSRSHDLVMKHKLLPPVPQMVQHCEILAPVPCRKVHLESVLTQEGWRSPDPASPASSLGDFIHAHPPSNYRQIQQTACNNQLLSRQRSILSLTTPQQSSKDVQSLYANPKCQQGLPKQSTNETPIPTCSLPLQDVTQMCLNTTNSIRSPQSAVCKQKENYRQRYISRLDPALNPHYSPLLMKSPLKATAIQVSCLHSIVPAQKRETLVSALSHKPVVPSMNSKRMWSEVFQSVTRDKRERTCSPFAETVKSELLYKICSTSKVLMISNRSPCMPESLQIFVQWSVYLLWLVLFVWLCQNV